MSEVAAITCEAVVDGIKTETVVEFDAPEETDCNDWGDHVTNDISDAAKASRAAELQRNDRLSKQMGQLLLKGYKMLGTTCAVCDCILMEDRSRTKLCLGCQYDKETAASSNTASSRQQNNAASSSNSNASLLQPNGSGTAGPSIEMSAESKPSAESTSSDRCEDDSPVAAAISEKCMVQGVDLTSELQCAVTALKLKLGQLAASLEVITDHHDLVNCLTSMTTTIAVLHKIKTI